MSDKTRGLFRKFRVERTDGNGAIIGDKHHGCEYFVLDLTHDKYALPAILAYAEACGDEYPALAVDLFTKSHEMEARTAPSPPAPRAEPSVGIAGEFEKLLDDMVSNGAHSKAQFGTEADREAANTARAALLDHERRLRERVAELEADALTPEQAAALLNEINVAYRNERRIHACLDPKCGTCVAYQVLRRIVNPRRELPHAR